MQQFSAGYLTQCNSRNQSIRGYGVPVALIFMPAELAWCKSIQYMINYNVFHNGMVCIKKGKQWRLAGCRPWHAIFTVLGAA